MPFYARGVAKGYQSEHVEALDKRLKAEATILLKSDIKINPHKDDYEIIKEKLKVFCREI